MIERIQINAAQRNARWIDGEQFAPDFFFRRMKAEDDDREGVHVFLILARKLTLLFRRPDCATPARRANLPRSAARKHSIFWSADFSWRKCGSPRLRVPANPGT